MYLDEWAGMIADSKIKAATDSLEDDDEDSSGNMISVLPWGKILRHTDDEGDSDEPWQPKSDDGPEVGDVEVPDEQEAEQRERDRQAALDVKAKAVVTDVAESEKADHWWAFFSSSAAQKQKKDHGGDGN